MNVTREEAAKLAHLCLTLVRSRRAAERMFRDMDQDAYPPAPERARRARQDAYRSLSDAKCWRAIARGEARP